jgi:hypothetical protein
VQQGGSDLPNGTLWNGPRAERSYSALILAARMTLAHFSVSSATNFANSVGDPIKTVVPTRSVNRALILGSARPALISLLSLSMIAAGVFLGTPKPNRCRFHGGAPGSGAPFGNRNGKYRHGDRSRAAVAERQKFSALLKMLRAGLT